MSGHSGLVRPDRSGLSNWLQVLVLVLSCTKYIVAMGSTVSSTSFSSIDLVSKNDALNAYFIACTSLNI